MKRSSIFLQFGCLAAIILCSNGDATVNGNSARIEFSVPNVSQLGNNPDGVKSPIATVRGINWQLVVKRNGDEIDVTLEAPSEMETGESGAIQQSDTYDVDGTFQLLSSDPNAEPLREPFDPEKYSPYFKWGKARKGCKGFITWDNFTNSEFFHDDQTTFAIEFTVAAPISILERPNPTLS